MLCIFQFAQITQSSYFAAQQISCYLIVYLVQINGLNGYFLSWIAVSATQVDVTCAAFAKQGLIEDRVNFVEGSRLLALHVLSNN